MRAQSAVRTSTPPGVADEPQLEALDGQRGEVDASGAPAPAASRPRRKSAMRRLAGVLAFLVVLAALGAFIPNHLHELREELRRMEAGDWRWLVLAGALEIVSFAGYVVLFRAVFSDRNTPISWAESYQITMAGVIATRLLATAGAGGVALTAWALKRAGMRTATVARRMVEFLVVLYSVYVVALFVTGIGLRIGLLPGEAPFGLTVPPAILGGVAVILALATMLVPAALSRRVEDRHRTIRWLAGSADTVADGVRDAGRLIRRKPGGAVGAPLWWGFDIAVLWASFKAFGTPPALGVVVMAYFVGTLGNLLPLPGGIGGVDGGIIAALVGFGVGGGIALLAVLTHRVFSFWLPTIPGGIAYLQLRRTVGRWDAEPDVSPAGA
jgi:putative heme transporter